MSGGGASGIANNNNNNVVNKTIQDHSHMTRLKNTDGDDVQGSEYNFLNLHLPSVCGTLITIAVILLMVFFFVWLTAKARE